MTPAGFTEGSAATCTRCGSEYTTSIPGIAGHVAETGHRPERPEPIVADCTKCGKPFYSDQLNEHKDAFGHLPEQHYHTVADLSAEGNPPVRIEIPEPVAQLIRTGQLTLAIVPDPTAERGLGLREITLTGAE